MSNPARISLQAIGQLVSLADYTAAFALRAACNLGVADHLAATPRSLDELAEATGAHAPSLLRVMRALVSRGIFREPRPSEFELNEVAHWLRRDHPSSLAGALRLIGPDIEAWASLGYSISSGRESFSDALGATYWDLVGSDADFRYAIQEFDRVLSRLEAKLVLRNCEWAAVSRVVDVGALTSTFVRVVVAGRSRLKGTLVAPREVAATEGELLGTATPSDRCDVLTYSRSDVSLPAGGDLYFLRRVLSTCEDAERLRLLHSVRSAVRPGARLLVLEPRVSGESTFSTFFDVLALVRHGGRLLDTPELDALLASVSLERTRLVQTRMFHLLEASPT